MVQWIGTAGDIASASTALGGLLLVFIGAVSTGFDAYSIEQQSVVRKAYLRRACLALVGFVLSLAAAGLSIYGKLTEEVCPVEASVWCLALALVAVLAAAVASVSDLLP